MTIYNLFPFNRRMSIFSSKGRRDRHDLVDFLWHLLFIGSLFCVGFFLVHPGIDPFLIQKKEINHLVPRIQTSASSVVFQTNCFQNLPDILTARCSTVVSVRKREFPFAGIAESSKTALSGCSAGHMKYLFTLFSGCDFIFL